MEEREKSLDTRKGLLSVGNNPKPDLYLGGLESSQGVRSTCDYSPAFFSVNYRGIPETRTLCQVWYIKEPVKWGFILSRE